eukprot:403376037
MLVKYYYQRFSQHVQKGEVIVRNAMNQVKQKQDQIMQLFEKKSSGLHIISPAFEWAQSIDTIYINIKLATRLNSPGCLDTFEQNITFGNDTFNFTIYCRNDNQVMKYELDLDLFSGINDTNCTVEKSSVGRLRVTLPKKSLGRWERLIKQKKKIFKNMHVWLDYQDQLDKDLDKYKIIDDEQAEGYQEWIMSNRLRENDAIDAVKREVSKKQRQKDKEKIKKIEKEEKRRKELGIWAYPPLSWFT